MAAAAGTAIDWLPKSRMAASTAITAPLMTPLARNRPW